MSSPRRGIGTLVLLALWLAGCGFHLQAPPSMPADMQRTFIDTPNRHSPFYRTLRRELLATGVELTESETDASAVFKVYLDETDQRVLSVSARNVPTEYEVYYTVQYGVTTSDETLLDVQDLTRTGDYTYDTTLVLGKAREEEMLRDALARDLVRIILKQIATQ